MFAIAIGILLRVKFNQLRSIKIGLNESIDSGDCFIGSQFAR